MTIEQAKEVLENHTQHFVPTEDIHALNVAIKSLDMWEKIVELINTKYGYILKATKYGNEDAEQQSFSYKNVLMYEVSDILDDILYDIEECKKEIKE